MEKKTVVLEPLRAEDVAEFKKRMQRAFMLAVESELGGGPDDEPIPGDEDIENSMAVPGAESLQVLADGVKVGGAVVSIDESTHRGDLQFFFMDVGNHSKGYGRAAWQAIEERYPQVEVWETVTPYFEKRNIHFYVNKCGFHIVEFYNRYNPDPHFPQLPPEQLPEGEEEMDDEMFRFEKVMKGRR